MALVSTVKTWLLVLPAVALLGVAGYRANGHLHADSAPVVAASNQEVPADVPPLPEPLLRRLARSERGAGVPSGLPLDIRADVEGETDLFAYAQRLRAQADDGNAEARWMLSRVYDYCAQYAMDPGGYRLDNNVLAGLGLSASPAMVQARERVARRCGGFVASDRLGPQLIAAERHRAAVQGNLPAEASLFADGTPLKNDADYRRDLVQRVLDSRDPEAYNALAPAMGLRAAGDKTLSPFVAGEAMSELAWRVAACELGMACGPDSVLVNSYCANGGICSSGSDQDFQDFVYDAAVSRQGSGKMNEWVRQLLKTGGGR